MTTVVQVLELKDAAIYTIAPNATVRKAIEIMADKNIGALVVTDENHKVIGIVSERDYTHKVELKNRASTSTLVHEIMTHKVITVTRHAKVEECLKIMTDGHLRHLPVVENDQLIAMIAIGDLVKAALEDQQKLIHQLQQYISG